MTRLDSNLHLRFCRIFHTSFYVMHVNRIDVTAWTSAENTVKAIATRRPKSNDREALRGWVMEFIHSVVSVVVCRLPRPTPIVWLLLSTRRTSSRTGYPRAV